jgi:hypothetical protein
VCTFAEDASGSDLRLAVNAAKGEIVAAGGNLTTVALPPAAITAEEARLDQDGRPLYPDGMTRFGGLAVVPTPAMATTEAWSMTRLGVPGGGRGLHRHVVVRIRPGLPAGFGGAAYLRSVRGRGAGPDDGGAKADGHTMTAGVAHMLGAHGRDTRC